MVMRFKLSRQTRFMLESLALAILYTALPILLLIILQTFRSLTALNLVLWLVFTLGWTALITYIYVKKISKRGGLTFRG
ncbi:MAG: hypothetical protein QXS96_03425 [Candidatus Caldarchaeum sp.]|jgi:hypothetical protein